MPWARVRQGKVFRSFYNKEKKAKTFPGKGLAKGIATDVFLYKE